MASSSDSRRDAQRDSDAQKAAPKNEMKVELNFSWFTKKDKPLISLVPRDHKSSSSSSGERETRQQYATALLESRRTPTVNRGCGLAQTFSIINFDPSFTYCA